MEMLEGSGFSQYEISNYSRPNRECRHNLAYWLGEDFLGLGPSAFSTVGNNRWKNVSDTGKYVTALDESQEPIDFRETLSESMRRSERIAFSLRTNHGVASRARCERSRPGIRGDRSAGLRAIAGFLHPRDGSWQIRWLKPLSEIWSDQTIARARCRYLLTAH